MVLKPKFFPTQSDFRQWLSDNHANETELIVGFYKVNSNKPSLTWSQSVDEALCFGWIDGVRRKIDEESYCIRFTPRKPRSVWSAVNIKKVEELSAQGLMKPEGLAAFAKREESNSRIYAYENKPAQFSAEFEKMFQANKLGSAFFEKQANWYRKQMIFWVMSAKQDSTKLSRLEKLINASANECKL